MTEEWKLQVSYKTPSGDLINVRANTGDELSINLESIGDFATQIAATATKIAGAFNAAPLVTQSSTVSTQAAPSWAAVSPPPQSVTSGPTCVHGQRIHKSGVAKASGKPYSMWVCPLPQGPDQCKPVN